MFPEAHVSHDILLTEILEILRSVFCVWRCAFDVRRSAFCIWHSAFSVWCSAFCIWRSAFRVRQITPAGVFTEFIVATLTSAYQSNRPFTAEFTCPNFSQEIFLLLANNMEITTYGKSLSKRPVWPVLRRLALKSKTV